MTSARAAAAKQDICQFFCVYGTATFTFGMLAAEVKTRSEHLTAQMSGSFEDLARARKELEGGLRESIRDELHNRPEHQMQVGMMLVWLTMTSEAAKAEPKARGFVLEFSDSPLNSRNPFNTTIGLVGPGNATPAALGRAPRGTFAHYWTEPTADAVVKLCQRFRARLSAGL